MNLQEVADMVTGVGESVGDLRVDLAKYHEQAVARQKQLDEVRETLFGDGNPGVKAELDRLSQHCTNRTKQREDEVKAQAQAKATSGWRALGFGIARVVIAAALIALAAWLFSIWQMHGK